MEHTLAAYRSSSEHGVATRIAVRAARREPPPGARRGARRRCADARRRSPASTGLAPATVSNIVRDLGARGPAEAVDEVRAGTARTSGPARPRGRGGRRHRLRSPARAGRPGRRRRPVRAPPGTRRPPGRLRAARRDLPDAHGVADGLADRRRACSTRCSRRPASGARRCAARWSACPRPLDLATGRGRGLRRAPGWVGVPVAGRVAEHLGVPSWVDNDATLGTLAEQRWGALRGVDDGVFLKLSDGVGAGLVLGGRLYRGPDGTAGEIGHVAVDPGDRFAAVCRCGHRGCLETVVSTRTVIALLEPLLGAPLTVAEIVARARDGRRPRPPRARRHRPPRRAPPSPASARCSRRGASWSAASSPRRARCCSTPSTPRSTAAALPGTTRTADVVTAELAEHAPVLGALALALDRATTAALRTGSAPPCASPGHSPTPGGALVSTPRGASRRVREDRGAVFIR